MEAFWYEYRQSKIVFQTPTGKCENNRVNITMVLLINQHTFRSLNQSISASQAIFGLNTTYSISMSHKAIAVCCPGTYLGLPFWALSPFNCARKSCVPSRCLPASFPFPSLSLPPSLLSLLPTSVTFHLFFFFFFFFLFLFLFIFINLASLPKSYEFFLASCLL